VIFGSDHKVLIDSMNETEAKAFMMFLMVEESRHRIAVERCSDNIKNASPLNEIDQALTRFETSAIRRHMDDLDGIRVTRDKVKAKFGWCRW